MQIVITFQKEQLQLPIATFSVVQGLLYRAMAEDPRYSQQIHETGKQAEGRQFKLFNFSELKGSYRIEGHTIVFLSQAQLTVRSIDAYLIQLLFSYFNTHPTVMLADQQVQVGSVILSDPHIYESEICVHTLSPITVYRTEADGHTTYFSPDDPEFYNAILINARRKWLSFYGDDSAFSLEIAPVAGMRAKKCATRFKQTFITGWHGKFLLKAPPQVLNFMYQIGLGSKNSQGFGMFALSPSIHDGGCL